MLICHKIQGEILLKGIFQRKNKFAVKQKSVKGVQIIRSAITKDIYISSFS